MMTTYGLRNHEISQLELEEFFTVKVLEKTKTGAREVWPCYPEWTENWKLQTQQLPSINIDRSDSRTGHSVTKYLSTKRLFCLTNYVTL